MRLLAAGLLAASSIGIALVQPRLGARAMRAMHAQAASQQDDRDLLPPPALLRVATLGHRAAAADILWSNVVVEYGRRIHEKRPFPELAQYFDTILAIEPDYAPLYRYCDAFWIFHAPPVTERDARTARAYLERGTRERPRDPEVWFYYGRFIGSLGPSFLASNDEKEQWRADGKMAIAHAIELGLRTDAVPFGF